MAHAVAGFLSMDFFLGVWANSDHLAPWLALFAWPSPYSGKIAGPETRMRIVAGTSLRKPKAAHDLTTTTRVIGNARTVPKPARSDRPRPARGQIDQICAVSVGSVRRTYVTATLWRRHYPASALRARFYSEAFGLRARLRSMRYSLDKVAKFASLNSDQALIERRPRRRHRSGEWCRSGLDVMSERRSATPRTFLKPTFRITNCRFGQTGTRRRRAAGEIGPPALENEMPLSDDDFTKLDRLADATKCRP